MTTPGWYARGTSIRTGEGAPTTTRGNGDLYIDSTTSNLYEQVSGAWVLKGNLIGATLIDGGTP
jgi:hypothetical protein